MLSALTVAGLSTAGLLSSSHWLSGGKGLFDAAAMVSHLQAGDVLFRGTRSLEGNVVRWFDGASDYTHVGVVVRHPVEGAWGVVHASSDTRQVTLERLDEFMTIDGMAAAGLYRWQGADPAVLRVLQADAMATVGRPFDGAFDAVDATRVYCTELIWMLAQRRGWAGAPVLKPITTPLGSLRVITIDALLRDLPLRRAWHSGPGQPATPFAV